VQTEELKEPVLLFEDHVIVPVGLKPDTVAVQVTGELAWTVLGEQETKVGFGDHAALSR
jgi:hypothetical protein